MLKWVELAQMKCCYYGSEQADLDLFTDSLPDDPIAFAFQMFNYVAKSKAVRQDKFVFSLDIPLRSSTKIQLNIPSFSKMMSSSKKMLSIIHGRPTLNKPLGFNITNRSFVYHPIVWEQYERRIESNEYLKYIEVENVYVSYKSQQSLVIKYQEDDFLSYFTYWHDESCNSKQPYIDGLSQIAISRSDLL